MKTLAFFLTLIFAIMAYAEVINVPEDFETIQGAIDASEDGDTVLVNEGVYHESITPPQRNIVLASRFILENELSIVEETILDGEEERSIITHFWDTVEIIGFTFQHAEAWIGGACNIDGSYELQLFRHCIFRDNHADMGGAIRVAHQAQARFEHCLFTGNRADDIGSVLTSRDRGVTEFVSCTFVGNQSENDGDLLVPYQGSSVLLQNCILYDNGENPIKLNNNGWGLLSAEYSLIEGGINAILFDDQDQFHLWDENIDEHPLFANPDEGDYHLTEDSPCIDTGDPDSPEDPDGTRADMGAFCYNQNFPPYPFDLLAPEDGIYINPTDTTTFRWERSFDPNPEDEVRYILVLCDTISFESNIPSFTFALGDSINIVDVVLNFEWFVNAVSGEDTTESESHFNFHTYYNGAVNIDPNACSEFELKSIYPNPFNSRTTISYSLPQAQMVSMRLYDMSGRLIEMLYDGFQTVGNHSAVWDSKDFGSGIYLVQVQTENEIRTAKLVVIK